MYREDQSHHMHHCPYGSPPAINSSSPLPGTAPALAESKLIHPPQSASAARVPARSSGPAPLRSPYRQRARLSCTSPNSGTCRPANRLEQCGMQAVARRADGAAVAGRAGGLKTRAQILNSIVADWSVRERFPARHTRSPRLPEFPTLCARHPPAACAPLRIVLGRGRGQKNQQRPQAFHR
ncbi:hypothetical protein FKP32DRAFT_682895 [Trametes sanguinea]|nr:hypothetical protein FKP32DRAFT_682895 [Trametes sanguinea]